MNSIEITRSAKLFNLVEAQSLLPVIKKITRRHSDELEPLRSRLDRMLSNDPRRSAIETQYYLRVSLWRDKIQKLGVKAAGLWVVEFDVGEGALNWRYPELKITHFRHYSSTTRQKLAQYIEETDPDWAW